MMTAHAVQCQTLPANGSPRSWLTTSLSKSLEAKARESAEEASRLACGAALSSSGNCSLGSGAGGGRGVSGSGTGAAGGGTSGLDDELCGGISIGAVAQVRRADGPGVVLANGVPACAELLDLAGRNGAETLAED